MASLYPGQLPPLPSSVDIPLQTAYDAHQWPQVSRLASRKTGHFYKLLKAVADSYIDPIAHKFAPALRAMELKNENAQLDIPTLDLLEWACRDSIYPHFYRDVIGPLLFLAAKAPNTPVDDCLHCLSSALISWDLVTAQQIAASLIRRPDRKFKMLNITLQVMLSMNPDQCPDDKKLVVRTLPLRLMQRSIAEHNANVGAGKLTVGELVATYGPEILLFYHVTEILGGSADWVLLLEYEHIRPEILARHKFKEPLLLAIDHYARQEDWIEVHRMITSALWIVGDDDDPARPAPRVNMHIADWAVWSKLIQASKLLKETFPTVLTQAHELLVAALAEPNLPAVHRKTILLAKIALNGTLGEAFAPPGGVGHVATTRGRPSIVVESVLELINSFPFLSRVEDLRPLVSNLGALDIAHLLRGLASPLPRHVYRRQHKPTADGLVQRTLVGLQLRYLFSTSVLAPSTRVESTLQDALTLLRALLGSLREGSFFHHGRDQWEPLVGETEKEEEEEEGEGEGEGERQPDVLELLREASSTERSELFREYSPSLSVLVALCFLKLSNVASGWAHQTFFPYVFSALAMLERQLLITPKDTPTLMLLVRLYLALGSVERARKLWELLDVNRTIIDSLSPLFLDRLSTVAPAFVHADNITTKVNRHYQQTCYHPMIAQLADTLYTGEYVSLLRLPAYHRSVEHGFAWVSSHVEASRAKRAVTGRPSAFERTYVRGKTISCTVDFGPFPQWECQSVTPLFTYLGLGPPPSDERGQLSLLGEQFFDLFTFRPSAPYKPAAAAGAGAGANVDKVDEAYIRSATTLLLQGFHRYLGPLDHHGSRALLTESEHAYYQTLSLLTSLLYATTIVEVDETTVAKVTNLVPTILATLSMLVETVDVQITQASQSGVSVSAGGALPEALLRVVTTQKLLPSIWYVRDTALAIRVAVAYALTHELTSTTVKPRAKLAGEAVAVLKKADGEALAALGRAKSWIHGVKQDVGRQERLMPGQLEASIASKACMCAVGDVRMTDEAVDDFQQVLSGMGTSGMGTSGMADPWSKSLVAGWKANNLSWSQLKWE